MLKDTITVQITPEEMIQWKKLKSKDSTITQVAIFRRGLKIYIQEEIPELMQNNNS